MNTYNLVLNGYEVNALLSVLQFELTIKDSVKNQAYSEHVLPYLEQVRSRLIEINKKIYERK